MLATASTGKIGRGFGKNAGKWTARVEISKEEILASKRSMYGYIYTDALQALNVLPLSSVFSPKSTFTGDSRRVSCSSGLAKTILLRHRERR